MEWSLGEDGTKGIGYRILVGAGRQWSEVPDPQGIGNNLPKRLDASRRRSVDAKNAPRIGPNGAEDFLVGRHTCD